jgi:hypothetical protein
MFHAGGGEGASGDDVDGVMHSLLVMEASLTKVCSVSLLLHNRQA